MSQRDPVVTAGMAFSVPPGKAIALSGAAAFDPSALPMTYQWKVIQQPVGNRPLLSSLSVLNPTFTADQPGIYVLSLSAGDSLFTSRAATVTITAAIPSANLGIVKTHGGNFTQGQTNAPYTVTVTNGATAGPTTGTVTVSETVPAGLTLVSMVGGGWNCGVLPSCTRSDVLGPGFTYPVITVTVSVAANAASPQLNQVSVSGGGSPVATATDPTIVNPGASSHPAFFTGEGTAGALYYLQFPNSNLFGYYGYLSGGWIYHIDMGYVYVVPGSGPEVYMFDLASGHWWYTSNSFFPYLYDFSLNSWVYYFVDNRNPGRYTTNPRSFVNLTTGKAFTM